ncbi:Junctophilin-2 [Schistosoma japonicum]|uniref:Junctophilin-2 n=1 Tax=Schistosoma japonicum TaxID=6182 RepID=A0A4Z2DHR5_SCHJA|nr:Junctophilin-2 [Schistosoma japonicum]
MDLAKTEATCLPAGRYEFKDSGLYIGEWLNEKAVGLGLITKDKCQGEYTGLWDSGSEKSGVFLWPNAPGAMYEGEWAHNRRNGYGIFTREDWVIMGQFKDDFIKCGIKCKENSIGRFEGEFENGFPSFGVETYADGGSYAGEYKNGVREGLGVRTSIPYGEVINFFPEEAAIAAEIALDIKKRAALQNLLNSSHHHNHTTTTNTTNNHHNTTHNNLTNRISRRNSLISQRSGDAIDLDDIDIFNENNDNNNEDEPYSGRQPNPLNNHKELKDLRMSCKFKCGFVLSSQRSELMLRRQQKLNNTGSGSLIRMRKELTGHNKSNQSIICVRRQGSVTERSIHGISKIEQTPESIFTLDQVDAIDPETVETFAGQWEADSRHGYGVCERSDGVIYEGQWVKNRRHGYGQTHFPDGVCEQGRYQNGKLVFLSWPKGAKPYLLLYNYHIMREVANAVKRARNIADDAFIKAQDARDNLAKVENAVQLSKKAAELARDYSLETRELVKEMYPDFEQPGIKYLEDMVRLMNITKRGNQAFDTALQAAKDVLANVEANLIEQMEQQEQQNKNDDNEMNYSSLDLNLIQPLNNNGPISRAGSYRLKRHAKHHSRKHQHSKDKMHSVEMKNIEYTTGNEVNEAFTLQVPQVNIESSFTQQTNMDNSTLKNKFSNYFKTNTVTITPSTTTTMTTTLNSLHVPNSNYDYNKGDNDLSSECDSLDEESRTTRSSSDASNYIILPTFNTLKPQSDQLTIPLNKLISNTSVMDDYFSQYKCTSKQLPGLHHHQLDSIKKHEIESSSIDINQQSINQNINQTTMTSINSDDDNKELSKGIVRRRTLPGFLTHPPLDLSKCKTHLTTLQENKIMNDNNSTDEDYNQSKLLSSNLDPQNNSMNNQFLLDSKIIECNTEHEQSTNNNSSFIYFTDDGIRKRAYAYNPIVSLSSDSIQNTVNNSGKLDPSWKLSSRQTSTLPTIKQFNNLSKDLTTSSDTTTATTTTTNNSVAMTTKTTLQKHYHSKCNQPPLVIANVMLEDPQDQLTELPTYYKESRIDLCHSIKHGSVPDVTKHTSTLSPSDLLKLGEEHKRKCEDILNRKRQGEIIIQLVDFFDWCKMNLSILVFILVNCILACFFYIIIYH